MNSFFLTTQPGFETAAREELLRWTPNAKDVDTTQGGVSFTTDLELGCSLNRYLKIPSRILLRLHHGKCKKIEDLKELLLSLSLRQYFSVAPAISFSSNKSKLYHKKKIPEQVERFLKKELELDRTNNPPTLYLRFDHDWLTVSVDTSGDVLYRRTPFKRTGDAPMRETLGSALYQVLVNECKISSDFVLIDPMCGSGTILSEALRVNDAVTNRAFAFSNFAMAKDVPSPQFPKPKKVFGFDTSKESIESANKNFESLGLEKELYHLKEQDLFSDIESEIEGSQTIVITNPPHGKRLSGSAEVGTSDYAELIKKIISSFSPNALGVLLPQGLKTNGLTPNDYTLKEKIEFSQGTNPVAFCIFIK